MKHAFPRTLSVLVLILVSAVPYAAGQLQGTWKNIAWEEVGVYDGEPYTVFTVLDSIDYIMEVESNVCRAYMTHDGRIYVRTNSFEVSGDSIYAEAVGTPLLWERRGDTLFTTSRYEDEKGWEKVTFTFLSMPLLQFPANWPPSSEQYEPDKLSPFGPFSFGTSPDDAHASVKDAVNTTPIDRMNAARRSYALNGRISKRMTISAATVLLIPRRRPIVRIRNLSNGFRSTWR